MTYEHRKRIEQRDRKLAADQARARAIRERAWDHPLGSVKAPLRQMSAESVMLQQQRRYRWSDEEETFIQVANIPCSTAWQSQYPNLLAPVGGR